MWRVHERIKLNITGEIVKQLNGSEEKKAMYEISRKR